MRKATLGRVKATWSTLFRAEQIVPIAFGAAAGWFGLVLASLSESSRQAMSEISLVELAEDFQCYAPTDPDGRFLELRFVYSEIFGGDTYAEEVNRLPEDAVVFDIGANVGLFSMCIKAARPGATVLAVEPMPRTLDALRKNIELHELTGITVYPVALGTEENSSVEFTFSPQAPANSTRYPEQKIVDSPLLK